MPSVSSVLIHALVVEDNIRFGGLVYKLETVVGVGALCAAAVAAAQQAGVLVVHSHDLTVQMVVVVGHQAAPRSAQRICSAGGAQGMNDFGFRRHRVEIHTAALCAVSIYIVIAVVIADRTGVIKDEVM